MGYTNSVGVHVYQDADLVNSWTAFLNLLGSTATTAIAKTRASNVHAYTDSKEAAKARIAAQIGTVAPATSGNPWIFLNTRSGELSAWDGSSWRTVMDPTNYKVINGVAYKATGTIILNPGALPGAGVSGVYTRRVDFSPPQNLPSGWGYNFTAVGSSRFVGVSTAANGEPIASAGNKVGVYLTYIGTNNVGRVRLAWSIHKVD